MNLILNVVVSLIKTLPADFAHMIMPMLLLLISVIFPVVPLNSSGILTLYDTLSCLSLWFM